MMNYYNDNDPKACAWLRELIAAGELPAGDVDCRSITEIKADELAEYDQCHFFAGIGGWPLALRWAGLEGWPGIWTGSCPCQPFSCAGTGKGTSDERHLWPVFRDLIRACRPAVVFGEQVASAAVVGHVGARPAKAAGTVWLDGVRADMEAQGYAFGAAVLGAHSVGAPHIRQRCYWVADGTTDSCGARTRRNAGTTSGAEACGCGPWSTDGMHGGDNSGAHGVACRSPDSSLQRAGRSVSPEQGGNWKDDGLFGPNGATGGLSDPTTSRHAGTGQGASVDGIGENPLPQRQGCEPELAVDGNAGRPSIATCGRLGADGGAPWPAGHAEQLQQAGGASHLHGEGRKEQQRGRIEPAGLAEVVGSGGARDPARDDQQRDRESGAGVRREEPAGGSVPWGEYRIHRYLDNKDRRIPIESWLFPLADDRHPLHRGRVGLLRGAGNAIVPALAAEFIMAWKETNV